MAAGPFFPHSTIPVTASRLFPSIHVGAGSNGHRIEGLGVEASLGADSTWHLSFKIPPVLPTGTGKLELDLYANATAGDMKLNPKWASIGVDEDPSSATLNAEGTSTVTWSAGNNDDRRNLKVALDADTLVAGELVVMHLVFETAGYTLAQVLTVSPSIIFE